MSGAEDPKDPQGGSQPAPRWAADEPTAMWDEDALREHGLDQALSTAAKPPATAREVRGDDPSTVQAPGAPVPPSAASPGGGGLSWPLTIVIAVAVAVVSFVVVRLLR